MGGCSEIAAPLRKKEHDVPDELLELVFLRLPSSLHLVRAACTCKRWRRIIAHGGFLRRFRSLLASSPLVAGHYRVDDRKDGACPPGCNPVFFLSPTADALGFRPEHFSLDFLTSRDSGSWDIADSQGGLVLLSECTEEQGGEEPLFQDLIVCEPLSRQYRVIPRPAWLHGSLYCGAFLLGGDADKTGERISLSNFRIIASLVLRGIARAAIFSSGSESDSGWKTASITADSLVRPQHRPYFQGQVAQSIYWSTVENEIIALHKETAQFSCSFFPDETWYCRLRFVGCDDGKVRIARLGHIHLKVFVKEEGADEWVLEKSVELQQLVREVRNQDDGELQAYMLNKIVSAAEGSVLLCTDGGVGLVSLDLATMELKRVAHDKDKYHGPAYMYELPWPPTIQACLD
ncbi:hypothetical protein QYE76_007693 [Lolium multiflorum]|uniref:F-box domain-containing protein n=1 Tax=Lolium multiflorum TaxID=4521 RepID=A0AAD8VEY3_LOLMU|nr:hypothetical protein QYE76_007693 [Lolium multiflorum]